MTFFIGHVMVDMLHLSLKWKIKGGGLYTQVWPLVCGCVPLA